MDELAARQAAAVDLGIPAFAQAASRTITAPAVLASSSKPDRNSPLPQLKVPTRTP